MGADDTFCKPNHATQRHKFIAVRNTEQELNYFTFRAGIYVWKQFTKLLE